MINLLPPNSKRELRAARANIKLLGYCIMLFLTIVPLAGIFAVGFWITSGDKTSAESAMQTSQQAMRQYGAVRKEAQQLATDLISAKTILAGGVNFSQLLTSVAGSVPRGVILNNLTLGTSQRAPLDIIGRARTYSDAINLKNSLEASDVFDNVSIVSISQANSQSSSQESQLNSVYPFSVNLKAQLAKGMTGVAK
jgi:Tfp pilus assembly protein PilN